MATWLIVRWRWVSGSWVPDRTELVKKDENTLGPDWWYATSVVTSHRAPTYPVSEWGYVAWTVTDGTQVLTGYNWK